jgi:predicted RNA-binding Zn-ribbon protein involved in translation (DUF1610 family)
MATLTPRCSPSAYISPQHSPALGFGSPAMAQGEWEQQQRSHGFKPPVRPRSGGFSSSYDQPLHPYYRNCSLPSPPQQQHEPKFVLTHSDFDPSMHGDTPLTPPASSDGLMSPPTMGQEFGDASGMSNVWMYNYESVKRTVPIEFIEDIFNTKDDPSVYINSANGFGIPPRKRTRDSEYVQQQTYSAESSMSPRPAPSSPRPAPSSPRPRKKRHLTEASEATYTCDTCGKYFSRIWNYNAHQDTHNPHRPRPHSCPHQNCGKAFVRRTDLTRHMQCVHAKDKKFRCELCGGNFARKDTLRRLVARMLAWPRWKSSRLTWCP